MYPIEPGADRKLYLESLAFYGSEGGHCARQAHSAWDSQNAVTISYLLLEHHESGSLSLGMDSNK